MPRNEEGEFELVLGNRQLLSGFFIVVILFGVFFTMGYVVGRHSTPSTVAPGVSATVSGSVPSDSPSAELRPGQAEVVSARPSVPEPSRPAGEPPVVTRSAPEPKKAEPKTETPKSDAKKRSETPIDAPALAGPVKGAQYYQVSAPRRAAAEGVVAALRSRGFKPLTVAGPDPDTVRILVGPIEAGEAVKTKTKLEESGFKNPWLRKF